jgi:hypothetical protein
MANVIMVNTSKVMLMVMVKVICGKKVIMNLLLGLTRIKTNLTFITLYPNFQTEQDPHSVYYLRSQAFCFCIVRIAMWSLCWRPWWLFYCSGNIPKAN